ncbi:MAG: zinc ribbon domain-containing protein [Actinomycetota bacterium]
MPLYEYRCRTCDETFERRRPMSEASQPAECSAGHVDSMRLLSMFASVGANGSTPTGAPPQPATGGCGSACGCRH